MKLFHLIIMRLLLFSHLSQWSLYNVLFDIILISKPLNLIQWFILTLSTMTLTTYLNVSFFSNITVNVEQGLKHLFLLIIFENITSYCQLRQSLVQKTFALDFLKHFRTRIYQRILSANWNKIKLSDQEDVRRKIDSATMVVHYFVDQFIDRLTDIFKFIMAIITIFYICPIATILIGVVYLCFYRIYSNKQKMNLFDINSQMIKKNSKLYGKHSRLNANMFEYVIHHEKDKIIDITNQIKIDIQQNWFELEYLYSYLSFKEDILGKICTFVTILMYYKLNGTIEFIIPLYHYLSTLTKSIHKTMTSYTRWLKVKKDYDIIQPILEEYIERANVEQIDLQYQFQIQDLSFQYQGSRETFHLQHHGSLTFKMGESILITGKSGAGNIHKYYSLHYKLIINNIHSR